MSMPCFVDPTLTELQTRSVTARASGIDSMSMRSAGVMPSETRAEYPPMKLTSTVFAHSSSVRAIVTKSDGRFAEAPPISATGVTLIRLLTIGTPNSAAISSPVFTSLSARPSIFSLIFAQVFCTSLSIQSRRLMPIVMVRTSKFSFSIIWFVSVTSLMLIMASPRAVPSG